MGSAASRQDSDTLQSMEREALPFFIGLQTLHTAVRPAVMCVWVYVYESVCVGVILGNAQVQTQTAAQVCCLYVNDHSKVEIKWTHTHTHRTRTQPNSKFVVQIHSRD